MNAEVIKAMNKKKKEHTFRKWWNKNRYKIMRVIFFPIWWSIKIKEKIKPYLTSKYKWDDNKAQEILNYYIPRIAEWDEEDKTFYFFDDGFGWGMKYNQKQLKFRDRKWWKYNCDFFGGKIRSYLIENFELEGFTKEIGNCYDGWTEVCFRLIEK